MNYEQIKYETRDGILTITLNRPDKLNAFTGKMLSELLDAMDRADRDDDVLGVEVEPVEIAALDRAPPPVGRDGVAHRGQCGLHGHVVGEHLVDGPTPGLEEERSLLGGAVAGDELLELGAAVDHDGPGL